MFFFQIFQHFCLSSDWRRSWRTEEEPKTSYHKEWWVVKYQADSGNTCQIFVNVRACKNRCKRLDFCLEISINMCISSNNHWEAICIGNDTLLNDKFSSVRAGVPAIACLSLSYVLHRFLSDWNLCRNLVVRVAPQLFESIMLVPQDMKMNIFRVWSKA